MIGNKIWLENTYMLNVKTSNFSQCALLLWGSFRIPEITSCQGMSPSSISIAQDTHRAHFTFLSLLSVVDGQFGNKGGFSSAVVSDIKDGNC